MKATIEFNDSLYRELKIEAAKRNKKIKEMVEEGVRLVLQRSECEKEYGLDPVPIVRRSKNKPLPEFSNADIENLLLAEDVKKYGSS